MTLLPKVKLRMLPTFPSNVIGGVGLEATKNNGAVTLDYAWQEFGVIDAVPTSPTSYILTYDSSTSAYVMVPSHLLGGAVAGIADAPTDGRQYGRQSAAWTSSDFQQSGTSAVIRAMQDKARDIVNVKDFGAVCDGIADDTAALQAALNTGRQVHFSGTLKTTSTVTITVNGTQLIGSSQFTAIIASIALSSPVITVAGGINIMIANCSVTHTGTAVVGGDGIRWLGRAPVCTLQRLNVTNNYINLALGPATFSHLKDIWTASAILDNIQMRPTATETTFQWQINQVISQGAGRHGMFVTAVGGPSGTTCSVGNWSYYNTFGNGGAGLYIQGSATTPISSLRLSDSFLGEDGASEIIFDSTYAGSHIISDTYIELSPTFGIYISTNNIDVLLDNVMIASSVQDGINSSALELGVVGGKITGNTSAGIRLGVASLLTMSGTTIKLNGLGLYIPPVAVSGVIAGCTFFNNTTTISNSTTGTLVTADNNFGI